MYTYIKNLQNKEEITRKQILIGSLVVCMSLVGFLWISTLGSSFKKDDVAKKQEDIKPFALLGQSISDTVGNVTASVGKIPALNKEVKKVEVGKQIEMIPVENQ